uniref:Armadillo repeat containing 12 n=1 Tax=Oryctolagus cuniculus TaxID=9986 RepID=A0A5F9CHM3_RABIT|nr:colipase-like protein 2 isoform X2 [Oryctolagus cuniculus]
MATALVLLMNILLLCCGELSKSKKANRVRCSHHTECFSNCCLMELDTGGNFCAPKARLNNVCLPQTKGAFNFICPCRRGLNCIAKDTMCPRRCHII